MAALTHEAQLKQALTTNTRQARARVRSTRFAFSTDTSCGWQPGKGWSSSRAPKATAATATATAAAKGGGRSQEKHTPGNTEDQASGRTVQVYARQHRQQKQTKPAGFRRETGRGHCPAFSCGHACHIDIGSPKDCSSTREAPFHSKQLTACTPPKPQLAATQEATERESPPGRAEQQRAQGA